jgi:CheY-like chemotaxis protein
MATSVHSPPIEPLEGLCVLVVDDDAAVLLLLSAILRRSGAEVVSASSAGEAFEALTRAKFDLLLTDIRMPGEDGYALLERVRALEPACGGQIPAIACTGFLDSDDHAYSIAAGFDAHLMKPVEPENLVKVIARLAR